MLSAALARLRPDKAWVVPAFHSPLKRPARAPASERLALIRLALREGLPASCRGTASVSEFELRRGRKTYTYETLRHFRRAHPGAELHFLAGSDAVETFPAWKRPSEIRALCRFLLGRRPGGESRSRTALPRRSWLPGVFPDISSTGIRARLLAGAPVKKLVHKAVLRRIRKRRLYGADLARLLSKEISPKRFKHSLCVARRALELAEVHGLDEERAALAGLLHDCGRAIPPRRMPAYAKRRGLKIPHFDETARRRPLLLHGYISEDVARRRYGLEDEEVLGAIRNHVLGDPDMPPLDRLLYVADICSADREFPPAAEIRKSALRGLDDGLREAVRVTLEFVLQRGIWIHPAGPRLWNRLVDR